MTNDSHVIVVEGLSKRFGEFTAVDGLNFSVASGQFFGFLGPNGAGKTTTLNLLTGLLRPTAGRVQLLGFDLEKNPLEVKRQMGVVPEGLALFDRLTGLEYLNFVGRMYLLDSATVVRRAAELLEFMDLAAQRDTLIVDYSHGMKKKLALAAAVIHDPKILFLDEPFESLDPLAARAIKDVLARLIARGATIFLTSHVLEIVEQLATSVAVIHRGRLVACGTLEDLRAGVPASSSEVATTPNDKDARLTLEELFLKLVGGTRHQLDELSWL